MKRAWLPPARDASHGPAGQLRAGPEKPSAAAGGRTWAVEAKRQVGVELPEVAAFVTAERPCPGEGRGVQVETGGVGCVPLR